ncbi:MAG: hypothetical protein QOD04_2092 [Pseudonocardiales bacterium]|nr:hypothetical protein [Pseudonocardiales bacterium]
MPRVDTDTLAAYDRAAGAFADDWHSQPVGADLHALIRRFFNPGPTADIGCGSQGVTTARAARTVVQPTDSTITLLTC